ncbi:MAG: hypothetical protein HY925_14845 [Elusimicrobia bacterium]|nr:hypothetical protein [Elusimicrobiota bacterium]
MIRLLPAVLVASALAIPAHASDCPWFVELRHTRHSSSVQLGYQIRFDSADLRQAPRRLLAGLTAPFRTIDDGARSLLSGTRVNLYGLKFKPFKDLRRRRPGGARSSGIVASAPPPPAGASPRPKLDLAVYLEDARRDAKREARRWMIDTLFDAALPMARGAPWWQKEAVARDLVDMTRVWGLPL